MFKDVDIKPNSHLKESLRDGSLCIFIVICVVTDQKTYSVFFKYMCQLGTGFKMLLEIQNKRNS